MYRKLVENRRHIKIQLTACLLGLLALATPALAAPGTTACAEGTPAFPVPETRNGVTLWSDNFQPAIPVVGLPADRDSTIFSGDQLPGAGSGLELFSSIDILGDFLYVTYNAGFQVWSVAGGNEADPLRLGTKDGWRGDFFDFQHRPTEFYYLIWNVDAIDPAGGGADHILAVSGDVPAGLTLWDATNKNNPRQLYQDNGRGGYEARMATINGRIYAFFATFAPGTGGQGGIHVYDVTQAKLNASAVGCLEDTTTSITCPGVYKGKIGPWPKARFLDMIEKDGKHYLATSDSDIFNDLRLEIREIVNPAVPSSGTIAKINSGDLITRGMAMFQHPGDSRYYLAVKEFRELKIYDITNCLSSTGTCSTFGPLVWSINLGSNAGQEYLTYSQSGSRPFLYYGAHKTCSEGSKLEHLWDISNISNPTEVTESGGTYTDPANGLEVDYWGSYYDGNTDGFSTVTPRKGMFRNEYFYRAAWTIFDVHIYGDSLIAPSISTAANNPPPYWFGEAVPFTATANNCPGPESWEWFADDTNASGLGPNDATAEITWNLCATGDCPDKSIEVWALKNACVGDPNLIENRTTVTVQDPRPRVRSVIVDPPPTPPIYPICTLLSFTANVDGKMPFHYDWKVFLQGQSSPVETFSGTGEAFRVFTWDTSSAPVDLPPEIFADGFESGNVSAWDRNAGAPARLDTATKGAGATSDFDVELTVSNGASDQVVTVVTLEALGALGFDATPIDSTDQGGGIFSFVANSQNALEWRWEFEQTNAAGNPAPPVIYDWGQAGANVSFTWTPPNVAGRNYEVKVSIRNSGCAAGEPDPITETIQVFVSQVNNPTPPTLDSFDIDPAELGPGGDCTASLGFCFCDINQPISFRVTSADNPDSYEFDWDGDGTFDQATAGGTNRVVSHTYTTILTNFPKSKAVKFGLDSAIKGAASCPQGVAVN